MTEDALVPTTPSPLEHKTLVALTPADVIPAQQELSAWCGAKMRALGKDYTELRANLKVATRNRWSRGGLVKAVASMKRRIQYYRKMQVAVDAGYLIIPNLPLEIFAVRVERDSPATKYATYPSSINEAKPELLPADTGRYVDETLPHRDVSYPVIDPRTKESKTVRQVMVGDDYREEVDFPLVAVKPVIMEATVRAMALHVFDQLGVAVGSTQGNVVSQRRRRSDPMVVGQLIDPRSTKYNQRVVSFFVAWWLDTDSL